MIERWMMMIIMLMVRDDMPELVLHSACEVDPDSRVHRLRENETNSWFQGNALKLHVFGNLEESY